MVGLHQAQLVGALGRSSIPSSWALTLGLASTASAALFSLSTISVGFRPQKGEPKRHFMTGDTGFPSSSEAGQHAEPRRACGGEGAQLAVTHMQQAGENVIDKRTGHHQLIVDRRHGATVPDMAEINANLGFSSSTARWFMLPTPADA